ncbi:MAG: FtsQ-type POTRA domain-containing protein [Gloeomargarita sp. SKYG116]|nr:FtsQ-type POTRA domain-containing protein [Gloeomargarita sp. SKYG116]MCS7226617.1 FtsQ-type POTRA domain-containing protein [Gloeomargarita sp. SKYB31]MDW8400520.1 FtsQ-type POTRA domain-containing protein [Gloeomargarita sp. SKYGB_i_bin116]
MDFRQRRQQMRRQQRYRLLLEVWQTLATVGTTAGLAWLVQHPSWWVVRPEQVVIHTDGLLTEARVRQWLQFDQPQPLWQLSPTVLTARLQQQPVVAQVRVRRQAFPARVDIWVQERQPVAVLVCQPPCPPDQQGFLDVEGNRLGPEYAPVLRQLQRYPSLHVRGWHPTQKSLWPQVYRAIVTSPVRVRAIDWEQPGDIRLQTELGWIRLGSDLQQLPAQLVALDRLRHLPRQVPLQRIAAIDLSDPQAPLIELRPEPLRRPVVN